MSAYDYQERVETARLNAARAVTRALCANWNEWTPVMRAQSAEAFQLLWRCADELRLNRDDVPEPFGEPTNAWSFAIDCIAAWVAVDAWRRAVAGQ